MQSQVIFCGRCLNSIKNIYVRRVYQYICLNYASGGGWTKLEKTVLIEKIVKVLDSKGYIVSSDTNECLIAKPKYFMCENVGQFVFCNFDH